MITENRTTAHVRQLRLILEAEDYEATVTFHRDFLGLTEQAAFEVDDSATATADLVAAGATLIAEPRETPSKSVNSRLNGPDGLIFTLFQELEEPQTRRTHTGFKRP